jgi:uncharacterized iron-regulated membrane protein
VTLVGGRATLAIAGGASVVIVLAGLALYRRPRRRHSPSSRADRRRRSIHPFE